MTRPSDVEAVDEAVADEDEQRIVDVGRCRRVGEAPARDEVVHRGEDHAAAESAVGLRERKEVVVHRSEPERLGDVAGDATEELVLQEPDRHRREIGAPTVRKWNP